MFLDGEVLSATSAPGDPAEELLGPAAFLVPADLRSAEKRDGPSNAILSAARYRSEHPRRSECRPGDGLDPTRCDMVAVALDRALVEGAAASGDGP